MAVQAVLLSAIGNVTVTVAVGDSADAERKAKIVALEVVKVAKDPKVPNARSQLDTRINLDIASFYSF